MATYQRGKYWWYRFRFAGERIDEPTKSTSRTVAEKDRRHLLLREGFKSLLVDGARFAARISVAEAAE